MVPPEGRHEPDLGLLMKTRERSEIRMSGSEKSEWDTWEKKRVVEKKGRKKEDKTAA